jgi:hypothetical protein
LEEWLVKEVPGIKKRYPPMWNVSTHGTSLMLINAPSALIDSINSSRTCLEEHSSQRGTLPRVRRVLPRSVF